VTIVSLFCLTCDERSLKARHGYCFSGDSVNNVKFSWLVQFLHYHTTCIQHHGVYRVHISQAFVTLPWPHFHSLLTLLNVCQVLLIGRFLQPRFTIFDLLVHFDDEPRSFIVYWFSKKIFHTNNLHGVGET
jgi:hypothetical protein